MVFVLRVRTPQGVKRLLFKNEGESFQALQLQVMDVVGIPVANQFISLDPRSDKALQAVPQATLASLHLRNGDMLYIKDKTGAAAVPSETKTVANKPVYQRTARCQHGDNGRCIHCDGAEPATLGGKRECTHDAGMTCVNCSKYIEDAKKTAPVDGASTTAVAEVADWLCNHPETAFCPKCIPKSHAEDEKFPALRCSCNKAKGEECIRCMKQGPIIKVNFVPYKFFMKERKAGCQYKHPPSQTCISCADPVTPDYKGKPNCDRGHRPWPQGVCLNCAPPNVNFRLQKYRHCDGISFQDVTALQNFYKDWARNFHADGPEHRAALLFGQYIDEPDETKNLGAIRANVYALYVPPQRVENQRVRFLRDPNENTVREIASAVGMELVGWVMTTLPREGKKYGGKVFMSGAEIRQAALFQNRFKDTFGHSRFVTVVVEHGVQVQPLAYQVSDQCVALERDGVLADAEDPFLVATRKPKDKEMVPTVIYKDKPLLPGTAFIPDEFIVKCIVMAPPNSRAFFKYCEFPSDGGEPHLRSYLATHQREEHHQKLSDFNLLCYLPTAIGLPLSKRVAEAIRAGQRFPADLKTAVDQAFASKRLV